MRRLPRILIPASTDRRGVEFEDASCSLSDAYPRAIIAAGGLPWVFPCVPDAITLAEAVNVCDGVLLTGGEDIAPALYRRRRLPKVLGRTVSEAEPRRDWVELCIIREVFRRRKPLLAICRGHQLLNVALGGSLVVDLPLERRGALNHNPRGGKDRPVHKVTLTPDSILTKMTGETVLAANSSHHQAVDRVAGGLRVTGISPDGVVEVMEGAPHSPLLPWLLAVQFHPERLFDREPGHAALFRGFVDACQAKRGKSL